MSHVARYRLGIWSLILDKGRIFSSSTCQLRLSVQSSSGYCKFFPGGVKWCELDADQSRLSSVENKNMRNFIASFMPPWLDVWGQEQIYLYCILFYQLFY
jgi:hypothetical protein